MSSRFPSIAEGIPPIAEDSTPAAVRCASVAVSLRVPPDRGSFLRALPNRDNFAGGLVNEDLSLQPPALLLSTARPIPDRPAQCPAAMAAAGWPDLLPPNSFPTTAPVTCGVPRPEAAPSRLQLEHRCCRAPLATIAVPELLPPTRAGGYTMR